MNSAAVQLTQAVFKITASTAVFEIQGKKEGAASLNRQ